MRARSAISRRPAWKRVLLRFLPARGGLERTYQAMGTTRGAMSSVNPDLRLSLAVRMADAAEVDREEFLAALVLEMEL